MSFPNISNSFLVFYSIKALPILRVFSALIPTFIAVSLTIVFRISLVFPDILFTLDVTVIENHFTLQSLDTISESNFLSPPPVGFNDLAGTQYVGMFVYVCMFVCVYVCNF